MKNLIELDVDKLSYQNEINRLYEFGKTMTNVQSIIQELTKNDVCYFFELSSKIYQLYCV